MQVSGSRFQVSGERSVAAQLGMAREMLAPVAGDVAALEARLLAAHAWGMTTEDLVKHANRACDGEALDALLARRLNHEPVAHIVGMKEFWRDAFEVSPAVLTPRADSETVLEALLHYRADKTAALRMLDLGTGSGCLLLSALREYPQALGVGVDQSATALAVAGRNAARLGLVARAELVQGNWCSHVQGQFDVVISNPPYIPTGDIAGLDADVRLFEPHSALDGGADGLDCYRSILAQLAPHLAPRALVLFEVGAGQADDVAALGTETGFTLLTISPDLAGIPRVVVLQST